MRIKRVNLFLSPRRGQLSINKAASLLLLGRQNKIYKKHKHNQPLCLNFFQFLPQTPDKFLVNFHDNGV